MKAPLCVFLRLAAAEGEDPLARRCDALAIFVLQRSKWSHFVIVYAQMEPGCPRATAASSAGGVMDVSGNASRAWDIRNDL